jgi:hypothetical protein
MKYRELGTGSNLDIPTLVSALTAKNVNSYTVLSCSGVDRELVTYYYGTGRHATQERSSQGLGPMNWLRVLGKNGRGHCVSSIPKCPNRDVRNLWARKPHDSCHGVPPTSRRAYPTGFKVVSPVLHL